jgi:hypothetical protein
VRQRAGCVVQPLVAQIGWTYNLMIFQCCIMQYIASKR